MKILLSAYACRPGRGSEPGIGWNWARTLAERHEVHVLTAEWNRAPVEAELARNPGANPVLHYVPTIWSRARLHLAGWVRYYYWQWRAYRRAKALHAEQHFDLAHHITYGTWRAPCFLWRLGIPLIWGPVAGLENVPHGFGRALGWRGRIYESIRHLFQALSHLDPLVHATMKHAAAIVAANSISYSFFAHRYPQKCALLSAVGMVPSAPVPEKREAVEQTHILWAGRLEARKALPLLLGALALSAQREKFHLRVFGDGPERGRWEKLASKLGLQGQVIFEGQVPRARLLRYYQEADVFAFTSIRDSGGFVLLEAMTAGLPIACVNWAGPGDITTDACAIRVDPKTPNQVTTDLAAALERLAADATLRATMGAEGRERVAHAYAWCAKIPEIERIYKNVLHSRDCT